jgi:Zn-dependent peptidase ImmA (M78 family)
MRQIAEEERAGIGLGPLAPLDPYELAAEHGIPVYPIDELPDEHCSKEAVEHFLTKRTKKWSAALVPLGTARLILENPAHDLERRRSSLAHEISHHLLEHEFDSVLLTDDGSCAFNEQKEKEAKYLSGQLLIPDKAAQRAAFAGHDNEKVAAVYGVSPAFAQMRMYGARVIAERALAKQAGQRRS